MSRRNWMAIPALAGGALLVLLVGAQGTRGAQMSLDELAQADGMTQEEMAMHLLRALDGAELVPPPCEPGPRMFDDVPASNLFCPFIEELARRGITGGCGGNSFCPGDLVTRAQMASFIVKAQDEAEGCRPRVRGTGVMVKVGSICIDKYENSVWTRPDGGEQLTTGAEIDALCPDDGQDCKGKIFARSVAGVLPARNITWFQAQQALANSGKRLPTNAEWQMAASGTPDVFGCRVDGGGPLKTGRSRSCFSDWGVYDMVGNVEEWVADWVPLSTIHCPGWDDFSDDKMCLSGAMETFPAPGALIRGGDYNYGASAGPLAITGAIMPASSGLGVGFRGAR